MNIILCGYGRMGLMLEQLILGLSLQAAQYAQGGRQRDRQGRGQGEQALLGFICHVFHPVRRPCRVTMVKTMVNMKEFVNPDRR